AGPGAREAVVGAVRRGSTVAGTGESVGTEVSGAGSVAMTSVVVDVGVVVSSGRDDGGRRDGLPRLRHRWRAGFGVTEQRVVDRVDGDCGRGAGARIVVTEQPVSRFRKRDTRG